MKKSIYKSANQRISTSVHQHISTLTNLLIMMLISTSIFAQAPQKMSYQAVIRDASGLLVANQAVGMQISILQGSAGGSAVYVETQMPTTNANGLVSVEIGNGSVVFGTFKAIDWAAGPYFIKTETDPAGGTSYTITGTSQLLSVPYALHAETSAMSTNSWNTTGNAGTNPSGSFVGTTDDQPFNIRVNNIRAGYVGKSTDNSVFLGLEAGLNDDATNNSNTFIGNGAGKFNTTGFENTATGYQALFFNIGGSNNTATGFWALRNNQSGSNNTANGVDALNFNTTGSANTANGYRALKSNSSGNQNTATGARALSANTTGSGNTANGNFALLSNTTGLQNTATGATALASNTTGSQNTATGASALASNIGGSNNTANGFEALKANTIGVNNVANGGQALLSNTSGNNNTANGYQALKLNTTGGANTANGAFALFTNTTGIQNTATGYQALTNNTGNNNTANGFAALKFNTTGTENTANGASALLNNTTGSNNTATGASALLNNTTGSNNTANGVNAIFANTIGADNIAIGVNTLRANISAIRNVAIGNDALLSNTTGSDNIAVGYRALRFNKSDANVAIGNFSLFNTDFGSLNTAIGFFAGNSGDFSNRTAIGYNTQNTASNQVRIGNSDVTSIGGFKGWTNVSDKRFKTGIKESVLGLDFIMNLRPVTYHLDMDAIANFLKTPEELRSKEAEHARAQELQTGFVAQDVEEAAAKAGMVFSGVDAPKNEGDYYGLRYAEFVVPLVKAVQEQEVVIENQQKEINELKDLVNKLLKRDLLVKN